MGVRGFALAAKTLKFYKTTLKNTSLHPLTHTERNPGSEEDVFKAFAADDLDRALAATVLVQVSKGAS